MILCFKVQKTRAIAAFWLLQGSFWGSAYESPELNPGAGVGAPVAIVQQGGQINRAALAARLNLLNSQGVVVEEQAPAENASASSGHQPQAKWSNPYRAALANQKNLWQSGTIVEEPAAGEALIGSSYQPRSWKRAGYGVTAAGSGGVTDTEAAPENAFVPSAWQPRAHIARAQSARIFARLFAVQAGAVFEPVAGGVGNVCAAQVLLFDLTVSHAAVGNANVAHQLIYDLTVDDDIVTNVAVSHSAVGNVTLTILPATNC